MGSLSKQGAVAPPLDVRRSWRHSPPEKDVSGALPPFSLSDPSFFLGVTRSSLPRRRVSLQFYPFHNESSFHCSSQSTSVLSFSGDLVANVNPSLVNHSHPVSS